ncbi:hypothetical protein WJX82_008842 [Trebouxia sp. C0006]
MQNALSNHTPTHSFQKAQQRPLAQSNKQKGPSRPSLSRICLGTMFFGAATQQNAAHSMLNLAAERGVNCFDTAEMYPVPQSAVHQGQSEIVFGNWLQEQRREDIVVATKVTGPGQMPWIRGGPASLSAKDILEALEGSLNRLHTDYIDIYQLHWPDRYVPMFGEVEFRPENAYSSVPIEEQMQALSKAVTAGKVRHIGLSNESAWGVDQFSHLGRLAGQPQIAFLQNAYSLLCRTFDSSLAEVCYEEGIGLLAYSPLAMGLLTGKYLAKDGGPKEARLNKYKGRYAEAESRYGLRPNVVAAVQAYVDLAKHNGISPTALALRFVLSHPLVASAVVGAMNADQLTELLDIAEQPCLPEHMMTAIDAIHKQYPNPCP